MKLINDKNTVIFENVSGYDRERTFNCGQCFRWDAADGGWRGFAGDYPCHIRMVENDMYVQCLVPVENMEAFGSYMEHYLSLDMDYDSMKAQLSQDETMKKAIEFSPGIRVLTQPFFETLITFIISRNNNIPRIKKIVDAMAQTYGTPVGDMYAFPTPQQLADVTIEQYNELRMGFRSKYVYDAVQKVLSGRVSEEKVKSMDYADAQKHLMQVKGVGPKVADCVLLFSCEKWESFPKDVWINRAMEQLFPRGLPDCAQGLEGIAQQYIFHYARFNLEK
ncbi:MAG: DNA-3-methyladenine glycosylase 2 family protein [Oscillospiraceae bacterium]|nr:DNA-3-methyladenine glycosylase 2 family protein [Oscillospiraceae bacterium]